MDGMRALAVIAVMIYHEMLSQPRLGIQRRFDGGLLGVDVFFAISGFLITSLLLQEARARGRIRFGAFYLRRARRLLPALGALLAVIVVVAAFGEHGHTRTRTFEHVGITIGYAGNWAQAFDRSGMRELGQTWSLAIEEQFYLVWPLVVLAVIRVAGTFNRAVRTVLVLAAAGAAASAIEMAFLYSPTANITRLYFGTDTHAQSVLIGATLACVLTMVQVRRGEEGMAPAARSRLLRSVLVAVGLAGLAGICVLSSRLNGFSAFDYRGGITLSGLSSAAVILAAVCVPGGGVARGLSVRPLVWVGTVSYGSYLWHYPIFIYLDPTRTGVSGFPLLIIRVGATFALAAASFYLVERRVIEGTFWRSLRAIGPAAAVITLTVVVIVAGTVEATAAPSPVPRYQPSPSLPR
ncbi:MAG: acyltransferase family protein, partial [Acidimicrobiales bacterium]